MNKKKIYAISIVFMPILNMYSFPGINSLGVGELLGCCVALFLLLTSKKSKYLIRTKVYWLFVIYLIANSLIFTMVIDTYSISETIIRIMKLLFYTVYVFVFADDYFEFDVFKKIYIVTSFVAAGYLVIQYAAYLFLGVHLPILVKRLPILYQNMTGGEFNAKIIASYSYQYRPSGFFLEPASFCMYVVWTIPIITFFGNNKYIKKYIFPTIVIAILLSQSAIGYLSLAVCLGSIIVKKMKRFNVMNFAMVMLTVIFFVGVSIKFGLYDQVVSRISTVTYSRSTTGTVRLLRGLIVFGKLPLINKIFGIGAGNYYAFITKHDITTMYDATVWRGNEYMNLFSTILVYGGVVGELLYLWALEEITRKIDIFKKTVFIVFLLLGISSNIFYSPYYLLPMLLVYGYDTPAFRYV